jgi:hypothetical protein
MYSRNKDRQSWFREKGLKLMHLNINHLRPKLDEIKILLSDQNPDILCLSETFLKPKCSDRLLEQEGYTHIRKDRCGKGGGGILCYINESVPFKRRVDLENNEIEAILLETQYQSSRNVLVCVLYRPPNAKAVWFRHFGKLLDKMYMEKREIVIVGDVNIDLSNITQLEQQNRLDAKQKRLTRLLIENNLTQVVSTPTRVTPHSKTLIDHVYTSAPANISLVSVPTYGISDHYPVCITRKIENRHADSGHKTISYRSTKHFNEDAFMGDMFSAPWDTVNMQPNSDLAVELFNSLCNNVLNKHMPLKTKRIKIDTKPAWMNDEIKNAIHQRDFHKKKGEWNDYKKWRNKVCNLRIRTRRFSYFEISDWIDPQ